VRIKLVSFVLPVFPQRSNFEVAISESCPVASTYLPLERRWNHIYISSVSQEKLALFSLARCELFDLRYHCLRLSFLCLW